MNQLPNDPATKGSSANLAGSHLPPPPSRPDPFAPDLGYGSTGDGSGSMITPADVPFGSFRDVEDWMRQLPLASVLTVLGVGLAVGVAAYEMLKPQPTTGQRVQHLLRDIRKSLADLAEPAAERASEWTEEGTKAVKRGMHAVTDSRFAERMKGLFS